MRLAIGLRLAAARLSFALTATVEAAAALAVARAAEAGRVGRALGLAGSAAARVDLRGALAAALERCLAFASRFDGDRRALRLAGGVDLDLALGLGLDVDVSAGFEPGVGQLPGEERGRGDRKECDGKATSLARRRPG